MDDYTAIAIAALREAILGGVEIPSEFAPLVNQYLPGLAKQARFAEREGLIARMMGAAPEEPTIGTDSDAPERRIDPLLTRFPQGDVGTRMPNAYRGPLDEHEPRLPPPANRWGT